MSSNSDLVRIFNDAIHSNPNDLVCDVLHKRFKQDQPYTQLGHHRLIILNPYKQLELLNDATLKYYISNGYKDLASTASCVEPHIYDFATRAYYVMRRKEKDVAILLSGVSGSGKSTTHRHILNTLLLLSTHTRREAKLQKQVLGVQTILGAFGTAASTDNSSASRLAQLNTLYFNERGRIAGSYTAAFLLDKGRVTRGPANFDIFYQLLAGTTAQEKAALHISHSADHFYYLKDTASQRSTSSNDEIAFNEFKEALKICGIKAKVTAQICQLLAAILHLGNVQFVGLNSSSTPSESCRIKNKDTLSLVAAALGVATAKLEATLTHKLKLLGKEFCTAFLTVETATIQRDSLARALYSILVLWMVDTLNRKLAHSEQVSHCISTLDSIGFSQQQQQQQYVFHDLVTQFCTERIRQFSLAYAFDCPPTATGSCLPVYQGLKTLVNTESERLQSYAIDATDANLLNLILKKDGCTKGKTASSFVIQHFAGPVEYSVDGMLESNLDALSPDFILLFRYNCTNAFLRDLFSSPIVATETHPRDERTIIKAQLYSLPEQWLRQDCQQRSEKEKQASDTQQSTSIGMVTVLDQAVSRMDSLVDHLSAMHIFEVFHIRPNAQQKPDVFDANHVQWQLDAFNLIDYARQPRCDYMYTFSFSEFLSRYDFLTSMLPFAEEKTGAGGDENMNDYTNIFKLIHVMQWTKYQVVVDDTFISISFDVWRDLENHLRTLEKEARIRQKEEERLAALEAQALAEQEAEEQRAQEAAAAAAAAEVAAEAEKRSARTSMESGDPFNDIYGEARADYDFYDDRTHVGGHHGSEDTHSQWGDDDDHDRFMDMYGPNMDMSKMVVDHRVQPEELVEEVDITRIRQWWARFVWFCTWWIPSFLLRWIGKMQRQDVQMAWREKVTLCLLIFLFSASIIFFIVGLGPILCPGTEFLFTANDVSGHQTISDYWVSVRGKVYDVTKFVSNPHGSSTYMATKSTLEPLAGRDLSYTFPPPLTNACAGLVTDPSVTIIPNETIVLGPFVHFSGPQQLDKSLTELRDNNWYGDHFLPTMTPFQKGDLVVSEKQLRQDFEGWGRLALSINGKIYDITDYMETARRYPRGSLPNYHYLDEIVENFFKKYGGKDATQEWEKFSQQLSETAKAQNMACLDNAFYIGRLDFRDSLRCTFVNYLLLSFAGVMTLVIVIKFLAALQFGGEPTPEDQDKFVICQVPCYTEDEDSLRKTINSLTTMTYDDKRKLLFLIADGMIIGSGNDKPTPRILLDILGHDDKDDPEPVMFKSVGEGSKQLNYGKVYSGLYFHGGHSVPYVVVVKVGKSTERTKPGNRGKRDSQIICMDFLNKVHFNAAMTPLELELYRHIKHVIGVDPAMYEYILMVDSDTEVYPDALTRLVSCMLHDSRIIGLCGETELCNEDKSWTTRIQVYEYYISHHLVKAFESLFGSVTCLPGCFCMYRIRTPGKREPLIISPAIIHAYSDNQVDTLHKKNLLHLGEDRYLTTLMMKTFPQYKMVFTPHARCRTVAPDRWHVLLSQRRRWINSTIHNLLELILLPELCGFCCLSMRFVVMIDLIGTVTLPSSVIYLVYLIYVAASGIGPLPVIALGMLAGAYGLQALIFIFKRQWQHIGWMVIYLLAIPVFSFFIPIYAFWHFDDFSWGNTRVVVGDKKKQIIVTEDEKFDIKMIPLKKWEDYEQELLETQSLDSEETAYILEELPPPSSESRRNSSSNSVKSLLPRLDILEEDRIEQKQDNFSVDLSAAVLQRVEEKEDKPLLPEDDEIEREVRRILATSNLMTLTKKQVRDQLSQLFGVDLTIKKDFINSVIDSSI